jgi:hypothetical protein
MRLLGTLVVTVALASLLWTSARVAGRAAQPGERRNLIGMWELVSLQDRRPDGDVLDWMGKKPSGSLVYSADGFMALQIMRDPPAVAGSMWTSDGRVLLPTASANHMRDALSGYYAYFGTWDVDERAHTVMHHVRASLRSGEVGARYVRPYELAGEQLVLRYPVNAADGEGFTRVLVWRRAESF